MNRRRASRVAAAPFAIAALISVPVQVSRVDASSPAPVRDLAPLVAATPAGGTLVLAPGRYRGNVTLDKAITIRGSRADARGRDDVPVIDGGGAGTVLTVTHADVRLIGLRITGSGDTLAHDDSAVRVHAPRFTISGCRIDDVLFGVNLNGATDATVEHLSLRGKPVTFTMRGDSVHVYKSDGTHVRDVEAQGMRDMVVFFSNDAVVEGNTMRTGRYGLHLMYADRAQLIGNRLLANATGLYVMYSHAVVVRDNVLAYSTGPSGYGLAAKESDIAEISGNRMVANRVGLYLDGSPFTGGATSTISRNVVAFNTTGVLFQPAVHRNVLTGNAFLDNQHQVGLTVGGKLRDNAWTRDGAGNHWSDYVGYDAHGDGVGDVPYRADGLYDALSTRHPELQFFAETPAARILDAAARAFPVLRPEPIVVDDAPLVQAPHLESAGLSGAPSRVVLGLASLVLLAGAVLVVRLAVAPRRRTAERRSRTRGSHRPNRPSNRIGARS